MKADEIIQENPQIIEDEQYPNVKNIYREHYTKKRQKPMMDKENFIRKYRIYDDMKSILLDLVYNDQIPNPSNDFEVERMESLAKDAINDLLDSSYFNKYGEMIDVEIDFDELESNMHNYIFCKLNGYSYDYIDSIKENEFY